MPITDYRNAEAWISGDRSVVHPIPHLSQGEEIDANSMKQ